MMPAPLPDGASGVTLAQAGAILARHYVQSRPSDRPGCIDALAEYAAAGGAVTLAWEAVPLTLGALRDWLGY